MNITALGLLKGRQTAKSVPANDTPVKIIDMVESCSGVILRTELSAVKALTPRAAAIPPDAERLTICAKKLPETRFLLGSIAKRNDGIPIKTALISVI